MKFRNKQGDTLELSIVGWEFPNEEWLMVKIKCNESNGAWEGVDPSLTIQEAQKLMDWIKSGKSRPDSRLDFLEPELEFRFIGGLLRVYLEYRYRPPWKPSDANLDDDQYYLEFPVTSEQLEAESAGLKNQLENIPT